MNNPVPHASSSTVARDVELVDRRFELGRLFEPPLVPDGTQVVDAAPVPHVVVLGSSVLVVPMLLAKDLLRF